MLQNVIPDAHRPTAAMAPTQNKGVFPHFYVEPKQDKQASLAQGRPVYRDVEMVRILIAGDAKSEVVQKVTDEHRGRWPHVYAQFKAGMDQPLEGTPLDEWTGISRAQALNMKVANVLTVEHLAEVSDTALQSLGPGSRELRAKARAYIERASSSAAADRQASENQALRDELAMLRAQITEMQARSDAAGDDAPAKRGPGRPRKED